MTNQEKMQQPQQTQSHLHQKIKSDEEWKLLWGVRRSIRYHDRRRRFFDVCHSVVIGTGIILATIGFSASYQPINEKLLIGVSMLAMFAFLLDLLFRFSNCAHHHTELKRRFGDLEKSIITNKQEDMAFLEVQRLEIEKDEPPIRRALDILCHNELAKSTEGTKEYTYKVGFWQRRTSQLFIWPNIQKELEQNGSSNSNQLNVSNHHPVA